MSAPSEPFSDETWNDFKSEFLAEYLKWAETYEEGARFTSISISQTKDAFIKGASWGFKKGKAEANKPTESGPGFPSAYAQFDRPT
jgi:hypothetical protein